MSKTKIEKFTSKFAELIKRDQPNYLLKKLKEKREQIEKYPNKQPLKDHYNKRYSKSF